MKKFLFISVLLLVGEVLYSQTVNRLTIKKDGGVINITTGSDTSKIKSNRPLLIEGLVSSGQYLLYKENPNNSLPNTVSGDNGVAIGINLISSGTVSYSQGMDNISSGFASHAEGVSTISSNTVSHSEGAATIASGNASHAQGSSSIASGDVSHAEGNLTVANGTYSHSQNYGTRAQAFSSTAIGRYNIGQGDSINWVNTDALFEIGIGTGPDSLNRANALTVYKSGYIVPTIPSYADDAAADADSDLPSGALYRVSGNRAVYRKP